MNTVNIFQAHFFLFSSSENLLIKQKFEIAIIKPSNFWSSWVLNQEIYISNFGSVLANQFHLKLYQTLSFGWIR